MKEIFSLSRFLVSISLILALVLVTAGGLFVNKASAAAISTATDTMSSLKVSTLSDHDIQFTTPTGIAASATLTVTFPTGWTMGSVAFGDMDLQDDTVDVVLAATSTGTTWGAAVSGQVITFTNGSVAVAAGSVVRIKIGTNATSGTNQITNSSSTGTHAVAIGGTFGDSGDISVQLLTDDQVAVTATVPQSLTFSISDNAVGFGTLSASAACFASPTPACSATEIETHTLIVGTNAANGYTMTVNGTTLTNGALTISAIGGTNTASSAGTEQFGIRATSTGGSGTVSSPYAASGFAFTAGSATEVASASGSSANTTYSVRYLANITSNTEAGAYTATLTYVATANF